MHMLKLDKKKKRDLNPIYTVVQSRKGADRMYASHGWTAFSVSSADEPKSSTAYRPWCFPSADIDTFPQKSDSKQARANDSDTDTRCGSSAEKTTCGSCKFATAQLMNSLASDPD